MGKVKESPLKLRRKICFSALKTPGCVAPKDESICSIDGVTNGVEGGGTLKWFPQYLQDNKQLIKKMRRERFVGIQKGKVMGTDYVGSLLSP